MLPSDYQFEEVDKLRRKRWLYYSLFYLLAYPLLINLIEIYTSIPLMYHFKREVWISPIAQFLISTIIGVISFAITYYCVYKKCGTLWITLCLVFSMIGLIFTPATFFIMEESAIWATVIGIPIFLVWWVLSLNLRKTNRKTQLIWQFSESGIELLRQASTIEELNKHFQYLMTAHPQIPANLADIYEIKKEMLVAKPVSNL